MLAALRRLLLLRPAQKSYHGSSSSLRFSTSSYSTLSSSRLEQIHVPCRSNGHITLSLFHPLIASKPAPSVVLYLPPGPLLPTHLPTTNVASTLSSQTSATVVQINYRCSSDHQYPTPIHDVLAGYDWVLEHLLPDRAVARPGRSAGHRVKLGVCGELVGGSLAAMLALTECRLQGPCVAAAAINEPIVDWVFPEDESAQEDEEDIVSSRFTSFLSNLQSGKSPKASRPKAKTREPSFLTNANNSILPASKLLDARKSLFPKPDTYFDTFASPLLNLRTSGVLVPQQPPPNPLDEFAELALYEREDFHRQQQKLVSLSQHPLSSTPSDLSDPQLPPPKPTRRTSKRWPNAGSGLQIPHLHISTSTSSPLIDSSAEFARYLQKSIISQELKTVAAEGDEMAVEAAYMLAERRVQFVEEQGADVRLWSLGQTQGLRGIAHWFEEILG